jgi:hypothetical protein
MWILKNSKDLLDNLKSRSFSHVSSIKTLDFSTSNEVGLYVVLLEVLLFMPNSLINIRSNMIYLQHDIVGSLVRRNDNIFVMKRGKTLNSVLVFKYRLRSTIKIYPIYIGYLNSIRHHAKKGT